jgi:protein-S-isoprenylcysteine O-methyltransferase Ste14
MGKALETRIPPPIVAVGFAALMWALASYAPILNLQLPLKVFIVSTLAVMGALCSLSGALTFRRARTTIDPMKPHEASALVCTGIYRVTRNPMYLGLVFVLTAWAVYLDSLEALLGVMGFMLYIHGFQILPEERALIEVFGEEYREYQSRVRRWL